VIKSFFLTENSFGYWNSNPEVSEYVKRLLSIAGEGDAISLFCDTGDTDFCMVLEFFTRTKMLKAIKIPITAIIKFFMYNDYMKRISIIASTLFLVFVLALPVEARVLPRFQDAKKNIGRVPSGAYVTARLRSDRQALLVTFGNLQKLNNMTYTLMYQTNGVDQGVSGSLDSSAGNSVTRELLFGTCSSGVCRYHGNISNMKLEAISELPNGKRVIKRLRIRV